MPTEKDVRRRRILDLVTTKTLGTQADLVAALAKDGWTVTQSSVSRDVAALGLVKVEGAYRRPRHPARAKENPDEARLAEAILSADPSGSSLVVLRTPPGEANHAAVGLDRLRWPEIVGTIAGDDTIFVAVRDGAGQRRLLARIRRLSR